MKKVTEKELAQILLETKIVKGMPLFASVLQVTEPKCTKKHRETKEANPYNLIQKVSKVSILLNSDYEIAEAPVLPPACAEEPRPKLLLN